MTNGDTSQKTFTEGYIAGYRSVWPGTSPAYAVPAGDLEDAQLKEAAN